MTNRKFESGAFVFSRARGLQPRDPAELAPLATKHGLEPSIIPSYAGDRATIGRAIQHTSSGLCREGFLLRPIKRNNREVTYAIVRESKDEYTERVDHEQRSILRWSAESNPGVVQGDHHIAKKVNDAYQSMRDKICTEDWSSSITAFLEAHDAVALRSDGRIFYIPRIAEVRRFQAFLTEVGIDLFVAEMEAESRSVVSEVVRESVAEQLEALELEVDSFDGKQKPSVYARRLEQYQKLRERAVLYRDALGVGVERAQKTLADLERKVNTMLDLRKKSVVHRNGSIGQEPSTKGESEKNIPTKKENCSECTTLRFAGAEFTQAESKESGVLRFVSDAESAVSSAKALESMGLAGKWQKVGQAQVSIKNSGPPGETVQIRLKVPDGQDIETISKPLSSIGIEVSQ